ncbi:DUF397 domain-containing protein [Pseudonocardia zijingensis]|uniref:DUF397 domain-containing protein n=1 Tax=Pseudonocardia zijingensis TaxID=153376 RepID=A0ABP3YT84_9PSEU
MTSQRGNEPEWRKSSQSGQGNDCLEVCFGDDGVLVRDSKERDGHVMHFSAAQWHAFVAAVRSREFGD